MKNNFPLLILLTFLNTVVFGQSNSWILGEKYVKNVNTPLSQSLPTSGVINNNNPLDGISLKFI